MPLLTRTSQVNLNPAQLLTTAQELKQSLQSIQPDNSKTSQTITFALVATAMIGIAVYHYIKYQETEQKKSELLRELKKELENN